MNRFNFLKNIYTQGIVILLVVSMGILYVKNTWIKIENDKSDEALQIARSIEATLPKENLKTLDLSLSDTCKPQYQDMKRTLISVIHVNPKARFAYLYTEKNSKIYFIADSEPEDSKDYSPPGQEYTEANLEHRKPFKDGKEELTNEYIDRWGTWKSAYIPIKDKNTGKTIAVFGMDFNAKSWKKSILFGVIQSSAVVILLLLSLLLLFKIFVANKSLNLEISKHKETEEALQKSEARYKKLFEMQTDARHQLEQSNNELEAFSYSVSHDLRAPLRAIDGFSLALYEDSYDKLDENAKVYIERIRLANTKMDKLIDSLLGLSRVSRYQLKMETVNLSKVAKEIIENIKITDEKRDVEIIIQDDLISKGDVNLLRILFENLFNNAWKFTSKKEKSIIEFGAVKNKFSTEYFIRDNGVGFDMKYVNKLFGAFQRLHHEKDYPGTGIGLATVQRIIHRHKGEIRAESTINQGATFYFSL